MTKEQLQERVSKLEVKIEKTRKAINKYYNSLSEEGKKLADNEVGKRWEERKSLNINWDDETNLDSYYRKSSELREFENTLNKYKNQIQALEDLIEIPVLREFLNNWKEGVIEYNIRLSDTYKEKLSSINEKYFKNGIISDPVLSREYSKEINQLDKMFGKYIVDLVRYYRKSKNEQIKKDIEKEAQKKYEALVDRINNIVGTITNCKYLNIGSNGEINGIIEGDKGKAKVETIEAGGYNENIIVNVKHGQCFHYRVLVKELN